MSKEYFYEDEDGYLKENTRKSSNGLRILATLSLTFSIIIGIMIIIFGLFGLSVGNGVAKLTGVGAIFAAVLVIFSGYVNFVIISAVATLVENSDRSDMVDAIHELTDTIRDGSSENQYKKKAKVKRVMDKGDAASNEGDDIELPQIDISDISDE